LCAQRSNRFRAEFVLAQDLVFFVYPDELVRMLDLLPPAHVWAKRLPDVDVERG
jgi:hypothetical protein